MLPTSPHQVVVMDFEKRSDITDTTVFCPFRLITNLLRTCYVETVMESCLNCAAPLTASGDQYATSYCKPLQINPLLHFTIYCQSALDRAVDSCCRGLNESDIAVGRYTVRDADEREPIF